MYVTTAENMTIPGVAQKFGLDAQFLLYNNKPLYTAPELTLSSKLRKGTVLFLEAEFPSDMVDPMNVHFGLTRDVDDDGDDAGGRWRFSGVMTLALNGPLWPDSRAQYPGRRCAAPITRSPSP